MVLCWDYQDSKLGAHTREAIKSWSPAANMDVELRRDDSLRFEKRPVQGLC